MKKVYEVYGLSCQSCVNLLENVLSNSVGIKKVNVNFILKKLYIEYDEKLTNEENIKLIVEKLGFELKSIEKVETINFIVENLHCQSCVKTIENILKSLIGINEIDVDLVTKKVKIKYIKDKIKLSEIEKLLHKSGYKMKMDCKRDSFNEKVDKNYIYTLFFAIIIFYISMGSMFGAPIPKLISSEYNPLNFALIQLLLSIPVIYFGKNFYIDGLKKLKIGAPNMDSLIAIGTGASFVYSIYATVEIFFGNIHYVHNLYFESGVVIIALVGVGKHLETMSKGKTSEAIKSIMGLRAKKANLCVGAEIFEIDSEEIKKEDILLVRAGEIVPTDGIIIEGDSEIDESMLTGESKSVVKKVGMKVYGATLNTGKNFKMKVTQTGEDTVLSKIIQLVENAQTSKAPIAKLADLISNYFVKFVIGIAMFSSLIWYIIWKMGIVSFENGIAGFILKIFISILVIACPCSLGLATPTALIVGIGRGAQLGILIKSGEVLEEICKADTVIFDKTGTITEGKPNLERIDRFDIDEDELLQYVGSLEQNSEHLIAKAIIKEMKRREIVPLEIENYEMIVGQGIKGEIKGNKIIVGNKKLMYNNHIEIKNDILNEDDLKTEIFVAINGKHSGTFYLFDKIKEDTAETIKKLQKMGLEVIILTGDSRKVAEKISGLVNVKNVISEVTPEEKYSVIKELQNEGKKVIMVGDGINDSPALAQSDIGIAIGEGTDIALESSDVVLMNRGIEDVVTLIKLSKKTLRVIKENLFWAFIYNGLGIPVAAGVLYPVTGELLNPMIAGGAMALSSISVILNALRLKSFK